MKALTRLQSQVMFQAVENDAIAEKFSERAKQMVAFGVLVSAALAAPGAHAQGEILTPSACAAVGATVGAVAGTAVANNRFKQAIFGAVAGLGGAAAGSWLCSPTVKSQDSSYSQAASYGIGDGQSVEVAPKAPRVELSISERERLDELSGKAVNAKYEWKKSLFDVDQARQSGYAAGLNTAMEQESKLRGDFQRDRGSFAATVARLNAGADGVPPRAVGRYLEVSAALLELNTESRVSYQMLESRDSALKRRSAAYNQESDRAARMRASRS